MKRIFALSLALCLVLCACGSDPEPETSPITLPTEATTEATTEPTTEATEPSTEVTEPPVVYRHPLNGTVLEEPFTGRATAVVINNLIDCLPQHGISNADMIFELETEGGITRLLAIFSDVEDIGNIGPVRSARSFFNSVALAYDAPIIHCGGSRWGINGYLDQNNTIDNWAHINEQYNGSYFFRDTSRTSSYSWEHTLFTSSDLLLKGLEAKGYNTNEALDYGMQFAEDATPEGETANTVTVNFRFGKTTTMTYNADNGLYAAAQYGRNHVDANTGDVLSYANVLCLYTDQWQQFDGTYSRSFYTLVGEGTGHFACGGKIIPIKWSRPEARGPFQFMTEDGQPLTLQVGTTYVGICSDKMTVSYE